MAEHQGRKEGEWGKVGPREDPASGLADRRQDFLEHPRLEADCLGEAAGDDEAEDVRLGQDTKVLHAAGRLKGALFRGTLAMLLHCV